MTSFSETKGVYTKFEPFRATLVWNEVLDEFRLKVPQQFVRLKKGAPEENCFSGLSAVRTLESYLTENRRNLGMKEITTEKVTKLCQILINECVIESVASANVCEENKPTFQSSDQTFYRFCPKKELESCNPLNFKDVMSPSLKNKDSRRHKPPPLSLSTTMNETIVEDDSLYLTPNSCRRVDHQKSVESNWKSFLNTPVISSARASEKINEKSYSLNTRSNNSGNLSFNQQLSLDTDLDGYDDYMVYELALFRLLTLVEIPVLDGILQFKGRSKNGSLEGLFANFGLSSSRKKNLRPFDISEIENVQDCWIKLGLSYLYETGSASSICLIEINDSGKDRNEKRLSIYRRTVEATKKFCKDDPYYPSEYDDVLKEIFDLLSKKRHALALEACQLFLLLLPNEKRRRFNWLLKFMLCCSNSNKETKLSSEMPNLQYSLNQMRDCFVKCSSLSKVQIVEFLSFMINNCREILKPPEGFQEQLFQRQFRQMYTVAEPDPGISYCQRITPAQFDREKMDVSESALVELVTRVVHNIRMSLPEKIEWLEKFKREYPELFARRFNDLRW